MTEASVNTKWIVIASSVHRWDDTRIFYRQAISLTTIGKVALFASAPFLREKLNKVNINGIPPWTKKYHRLRLIIGLYCTFRNNVKQIKSIHVHDPELLPVLYLLRRKNKQLSLIYDIHENYRELISNKLWLPSFLRRAIAKIYVWMEEKIIPELSGVIFHLWNQKIIY